MEVSQKGNRKEQAKKYEGMQNIRGTSFSTNSSKKTVIKQWVNIGDDD